MEFMFIPTANRDRGGRARRAWPHDVPLDDLLQPWDRQASSEMLARGSFTAMTMKLLFMKLLFISLVARHAAAYRVAECGGVTRRGLFAGAAAVSGTSALHRS